MSASGREQTLRQLPPQCLQSSEAAQKKNPGISPRVLEFRADLGAARDENEAYFASFSISFSTMLAGTSS
jgi:hypothetical protein